MLARLLTQEYQPQEELIGGITTPKSSKEAKEAVQYWDGTSIVLVDGIWLTALILRYAVAAEEEATNLRLNS